MGKEFAVPVLCLRTRPNFPLMESEEAGDFNPDVLVTSYECRKLLKGIRLSTIMLNKELDFSVCIETTVCVCVWHWGLHVCVSVFACVCV